MKFATVSAVTLVLAGITGSAQAGNTAAPYGQAQTTPAISSPVSGASMASGAAAQLNELVAEWNRAGFNPPSKPGQYRVYGREGYVTSGPGYDTMVSLIRSASYDVRQGRDREASDSIAKARTMLAGITSPGIGSTAGNRDVAAVVPRQ